MALSFYSPPFDSNTSGTISGDSTQVGLEEYVEWYAMSHETRAPFNADGQPIRTQHQPITVTKRIDRSSPLLQDTLTKRGTIPKIEFLFYRPATTGEETHHYTITLEEAKISSIHVEQLNNRYPENMAHELREHVSFTYDKITWEDVINGIMAFDSWKTTRRGG